MEGCLRFGASPEASNGSFVLFLLQGVCVWCVHAYTGDSKENGERESWRISISQPGYLSQWMPGGETVRFQACVQTGILLSC